jgi:hypothetical protein
MKKEREKRVKVRVKVFTILKTIFCLGHSFVYNTENKITGCFFRHDGLINKNKNVLHGYMFRLCSKAIYRPNTRVLTYTESVQ